MAISRTAMTACVTVGLAIAGISLLGPQAEARKLSCDELRASVAYVDTMGDILEDSSGVSSTIDEELRTLAEGAAGLAILENDNALARYSRKLIDAWEDEDKDKFLKYGDRLADRLEYFYDRDC